MSTPRCHDYFWYTMKGLKVFGLVIAILVVRILLAEADNLKFFEEIGKNGEKLIVLENDFYILKFNPYRGGRCSSFMMKKTKREIVYPSISSGSVYPGSEGGFFLDHFSQEGRPGEFIYAPYKYEIIGDSDEKKGVRFWCVSTGRFDKQEIPNLSGIRISKTITLYAKEPLIDVEVSLTNTTQDTKIVSYWVENGFLLGGQKEYDIYYRPSVRNIHILPMNESTTGVIEDEWVRDPVEGWSAARDDKTDEGLVFLMDYNNLSALYNGGACTTEWVMDSIGLTPGQTWTTQFTLIAVDGFKGFVHASRNLIADIQVHSKDNIVLIEHALSSVLKTMKKVIVKTSVYGVWTKEIINLPDVTIGEIGYAPIRHTLTLPGPQKEPIVIKAEVISEGLSERYEIYSPGELVPYSLYGYSVPVEYLRAKPLKQKMSPVLPKLSTDKTLDVLLFYGLYTQWYKIDKALEGIPKTHLRVSNALTDTVEYLPSSYEELNTFDIMILSDVNANSLKSFGMQIISDFVEGGGGLLLLGGPFTFGHGPFKDTLIESLLPVTLTGYFDLKWKREGLGIKKVSEHEIIDGVDFSGGVPMVYWIHDVEPKVGGKVVLGTDDRPILVLGQYGKGRVAAFLGSPLGIPQKEQMPFWEWQDWTKLMQNTMIWLGGSKKDEMKVTSKQQDGQAGRKEVLVYAEDFKNAKSGDKPSVCGWQVAATKGAIFEVDENGALKIIHTTINYNADKVLFTFPTVKKGFIEFDIKLGAENHSSFSLSLTVGKKLTAFNGYNGGWWLAYDSKSIQSDNRWSQAGNIGLGKWVHCKIEFDVTPKVPMLKFYVDGKSTGMTGDENESSGISEVALGDYGLCSGQVINFIDNIKVFSYDD